MQAKNLGPYGKEYNVEQIAFDLGINPGVLDFRCQTFVSSTPCLPSISSNHALLDARVQLKVSVVKDAIHSRTASLRRQFKILTLSRLFHSRNYKETASSRPSMRKERSQLPQKYPRWHLSSTNLPTLITSLQCIICVHGESRETAFQLNRRQHETPSPPYAAEPQKIFQILEQQRLFNKMLVVSLRGDLSFSATKNIHPSFSLSLLDAQLTIRSPGQNAFELGLCQRRNTRSQNLRLPNSQPCFNAIAVLPPPSLIRTAIADA
ncbi:uncharacterized protein BDR25DRAFT_349930 [Lindgomyces ingoldianus]|uniref:Uncharacterized protein n=1 Tax=Lindgomyces ingoldianus TaxID=673940 RepID=A0ACB6R8Y4_9PLEO|nr:uncharacterized protein BDR25DRAFT_349930 [Lindgomyces ingoldianus]KAF2475636.1 hypothetical protein BDR25DRAFT_349930 [Lindgomyces ingoldianus]